MWLEEKKYFELSFSTCLKVFFALTYIAEIVVDGFVVNKLKLFHPLSSLSNALFVTCRANDHVY